MCKTAAFYEGGITYTELAEMPIDEFFAVIECAAKIAEQRKREIDRATANRVPR